MTPELQDTFSRIYTSNLWGDAESVSGPGSRLSSTEVIRCEIPHLLKRLRAKVLLDAPCGDCHWASQMDMGECAYLGADIVPELIEANRVKHPEIDFHLLDVTSDPLPRVDIILCRDLLGHLSFEQAASAIRNFKASGAEYLLTTSFPRLQANRELSAPGGWRPINLLAAPFSMIPFYLINENCMEGKGAYSDKCLILFRL